MAAAAHVDSAISDFNHSQTLEALQKKEAAFKQPLRKTRENMSTINSYKYLNQLTMLFK